MMKKLNPLSMKLKYSTSKGIYPNSEVISLFSILEILIIIAFGMGTVNII